MSLSKPVKISRAFDLFVGCFSAVPPSETLDHLIRFLGTWNGCDKFFQVLQYSLKLLIPLLHLRARVQHRAGLRKDPFSSSAAGYAKFAKIIGDSRTLWRIWGLLPIFQWLISLEHNPQPTKTLLNIERLQGWSMLGYYPLEHLSYLTSHEIIPSSLPSISSLLGSAKGEIKLNPGRLNMWSCRFWFLYLVLQSYHLREDRKLLIHRQRSLRKGKGTGVSSVEKQDLQKRWEAYRYEILANFANLPLALNWSTESGFIKNDLWITILNLVAAIAGFRNGWEATAKQLPPPPSSPTSPTETTIELAPHTSLPSTAAAAFDISPT